MNPVEVYRIGLGYDLFILRRAGSFTHPWVARWVRLRTMARRARRRSWWGFWQGEWDGCPQAVRALTRARCVKKTFAAYEAWERQWLLK